MKVLITGVTRTGNLGGTAMLCAVEDALREQGVEEVCLASILPEADRAADGPDDTTILDTDYRRLILLALPVALFLWPLRRVGAVRRVVSRLPLFRHYAAADVIADVSGIAFVDGRGAGLLAYNVAVALPALFLGTPVYKLSQALGPFRRWPNRLAARFVLSRCAGVSARGEASFDHLRELGLTRISCDFDVSFALEIDEGRRQSAREMLSAVLPHRDDGRPLVLLSPSRVVFDYCQESGIALDRELAMLIERLLARGMAVALLPHSTDTGIRKNDDRSICEMIRKRVAAQEGDDVPVLDAAGDPKLARAIIGESSAFLACRFHAMIAALSQAVPVVTVGWSHKYREAGEPFGMADHTLDYSELSAGRLETAMVELVERRGELERRMEHVSRRASDDARKGILRVLDGGGESNE